MRGSCFVFYFAKMKTTLLTLLKVVFRKRRKLLLFLQILITGLTFKLFYSLHHFYSYNFNAQLYEYENTRLNLLQESNYYWEFLSYELNKLREYDANNTINIKIDTFLKCGSERNRSLIFHINKLCKFDGYEIWRNNRRKDLFSEIAININENPSKDYEITRRQIGYDLLEFKYYVNAQLKKYFIADEYYYKAVIVPILQQAAILFRLALKQYHKLDKVDGFNEWRKRISNELSEHVQRSIHISQNKKEPCENTKILYCYRHMICGLGCLLHHIIKCLSHGYGTNRTIIYDLSAWTYSGLGDMFLANSETCTNVNHAEVVSWSADTSPDVRVLGYPSSNIIFPKSEFHPAIVPAQFANVLTILHAEPRIWWIGQLFKYFMRPTEHLLKIFREAKCFKQFSSPIVGIHIRRTDKIPNEANYHNVTEYMEEAEEYFKQIEVEGVEFVKKKVYVATDDPSVYNELNQLYPDYEFLYDEAISQVSNNEYNKYSNDGLKGSLIDLYYLSNCDYIVCTLSSTFCRMVYVLKQTSEVDATDKLRSLDDNYWFSDQQNNDRLAISDYNAETPDEISFNKGDLIINAGNHWDGYSLGQLKNTNKRGLYPSYKTVSVFPVNDFPIYVNYSEP